MSYELSEKAKLDLTAIWEFTFRNWSKNQADRYIRLLFDEMNYLSMNPTIGRNKSDIRSGYRVSQMKSHLIFYKETGKSSIEIVRVLHQQMDVDTHL